MYLRIIKAHYLLLLSLILILSFCKNEPVQSNKYPLGPEARFVISKLKMETYYEIINEDSTLIISCPRFIYWERPFHLGDTLILNVSQQFGAEIIGDSPVYATIKSSLGDNETYLLDCNFWPCEIRIVDYIIYHSIVDYNCIHSDQNYNPAPNNGILEMNADGDTLIASYLSYSTGFTLQDTVQILPK